jgi:ATP synthase protein I
VNAPANTAKPDPSHPSSSSAGWDEEVVTETVTPLTHHEAVALLGEKALRPSRMTPVRVVLIQVVVTLLSAGAWFAWRQWSHTGAGAEAMARAAAISALLGGAACFLPGALFALRLKASRRPSLSGLVVGEAIKISATIALLLLAVVKFPQMDWPALLVTFLLALKMYWVALAIR